MGIQDPRVETRTRENSDQATPTAPLPLDIDSPPQILIPSPTWIQDIFSHETKGEMKQGDAFNEQEIQSFDTLDDLDFFPGGQAIHVSMASEPKIKVVNNLDQVTQLMNASRLLMSPRPMRLPSTVTTSESAK